MKHSKALPFAQMYSAHETSPNTLYPIPLCCALLGFLAHNTVFLAPWKALHHMGKGLGTGDATGKVPQEQNVAGQTPCPGTKPAGLPVEN